MTEHTAERIVLARLLSGIEVTTTVHTCAGNDSEPTSVRACEGFILLIVLGVVGLNLTPVTMLQRPG